MSTKLIVMAGLTLVFGATSYYVGDQYLESQTQARLSEFESNNVGVELSTVVVATTQIRFGETLNEEMFKEVEWPKDARPEGSYSTIKEVMTDADRRAVSTIEPGEPVLAVKLTGENGRAGLAGIIGEGMRAVTIPVDTVNGVGGFVQPGDRVDILLTREDSETDEKSAKIIMENVKVLSVDQDANTRSSTAKVAKSVTLEADASGAQRLALANNVGRVSLLLRSAGDGSAGGSESLSANDFDQKRSQNGGLLSIFGPKEKTEKSVRVVAGDEVNEFSVRIEKLENEEEIKN